MPSDPGTRHAALLVEYDGADFNGWARQPGLRTVESELYDRLAELSDEVGPLRCAGRTDAGVHASRQVVTFKYTGPVSADRLAIALAGTLPRSLSVRASVECAADFDARGSAQSRAYEYRLLTARFPSPLRRGVTLHHPRRLDLDVLDAAAQMIRGQHDFTAFTPKQTKHVYFHRTVFDSRWERRGDELVYCIRADAFLRHMVRVLVGTMLAMGRGEVPFSAFPSLLDGAVRSDAHNTALPHGLCLVDVAFEQDPFG